MKPDLLSDVLSEGDYSKFRDQLRVDFRAKVGRRRHHRTILLAIAASIALIAVVLFHPRSHPSQLAAQAPRIPEGTKTFKTSPLKAEEIIRTSFASVATIGTHPAEQVTITTSRNEIEIINDAELFALFPNHPIGWVAGASGRQFVFIDPADARRFMSSN